MKHSEELRRTENGATISREGVKGVAVITLLAATVLLAGSLSSVYAQSPLLPGKLAIYYGFPSQVNGAAGDLDAAAEVFDDYDIILLGDSLQYPQYTGAPGQEPYYGCDQNSHFDHDNTVGIIDRLDSTGTAVYGYVSIGGENTAWHCGGVPTPHTMAEIESRVDDWAAMGVTGIFLDEAEYGFGCSRQRQNDAVDYVHSKELSVFINAWNPDEVFGTEIVGKITYTTGSLAGQESTEEMNPTGEGPHLGPGDIYLMESFQIINGEYRPPGDWAIRADKALGYKDELGIEVATVTTPEPDKLFDSIDQAEFDYAWWSTFLYGFDYMGWGEANDYSAWGPYADLLPDRARPDPGEIGNAFTSSVAHVVSIHTRTTSLGTIEVNTDTHTGRFTRNPTNGIYVWTDETSTDQDRRILVDVCTDPVQPLGMVLLSNYKSGGYLGMWPAQNLHAFNTLAHQEGLSVYALYTNKDWIDEVLQYNTECTDPAQQFDGYAMDFEGPWPSGGSEPSNSDDVQYYADAKAECGTFPLHVSIGWHWDDMISHDAQIKPAFEHILDIVNSVDVQTAFETEAEIEYRAGDEVSYATQLNKPVFPTIETQDVSGIPGMSEWNTFYEEGEMAMWEELADVDYGTDTFTGFILHYYDHAYSSGTALWPLHLYVWPLSGTSTLDEMTTSFGPRMNYRKWDFHDGIDLPATKGTPVYAVRTSKVHRAGEGGEHGYSSRHVVLRIEQSDLYIVYLHLDSYVVVQGQTVLQGQQIGTVGDDDATYPHLHFEIRMGGWEQIYSVHPLDFLPYTDTENFVAPMIDRANQLGDLRAVRLLFDASDRREGDLIGAKIDLKNAGGIIETREVNFNDKQTINEGNSDDLIYVNNIGVEGYQKSNMEQDSRDDIKYGILVRNVPSDCTMLDARVEDLAGNEATTSDIPVPDLSATETDQYVDFSGDWPPDGWDVVKSTSGTGTHVEVDSEMMLSIDDSTSETVTQRAGIEFVLPDSPLKRFEWVAEAYFNPTSLGLGFGQNLYLFFFHDDSKLSVAARIRNVGDLDGDGVEDMRAGIVARETPDGEFKADNGDLPASIIHENQWRKWTLHLLRIGTRETTAVLYLDDEEQARLNWSTTQHEPEAFRAGIGLTSAGAEAIVLTDDLRISERVFQQGLPGQRITRSVKLRMNIGPTDGRGITIGGSGITLEGDGYKILGTGTGDGVFAYGEDLEIKHLFVEGFDKGIVTIGERINVTGNSIRDNTIGLYIHGEAPTGNTVNENIIADNDIGIEDHIGASNIYHNLIINNADQIDCPWENTWEDDVNHYGNFWGNYWGLDDGSGGRTAGDDIGDTDLPHEGVDWHPLLDPVLWGGGYLAGDWWTTAPVWLVWRGGWSPVEIQVTDPSGNVISRDINEIGREAFYVEDEDLQPGTKLVLILIGMNTLNPYEGIYSFQMTALEDVEDYWMTFFASQQGILYSIAGGSLSAGESDHLDVMVDSDLSVTVVAPYLGIDELIQLVEDMGLHRGIRNSLVSKLKSAAKSLEKEQTKAARNKLEAFVNEVEAQRGKKLAPEQAEFLISAAEGIINRI